MMACTASHIKVAPFAVIGSIGVVAQVPNIHRLLKRNDIDVELLTAGKYKRTLTVLGENTEEGREKFIDDLENTHRLFKEYVSRHRPEMDIDTLATGEIWYGSEALEQKLVDSIGTSEAYLVERIANAQVYRVKLEPPKTLSRKVGLAVSAGGRACHCEGARRGRCRRVAAPLTSVAVGDGALRRIVLRQGGDDRLGAFTAQRVVNGL